MWYMKFKSLEVIEMFSGALNKKKVLLRCHKYSSDSITPALAEAVLYLPAVTTPTFSKLRFLSLKVRRLKGF